MSKWNDRRQAKERLKAEGNKRWYYFYNLRDYVAAQQEDKNIPHNKAMDVGWETALKHFPPWSPDSGEPALPQGIFLPTLQQVIDFRKEHNLKYGNKDRDTGQRRESPAKAKAKASAKREGPTKAKPCVEPVDPPNAPVLNKPPTKTVPKSLWDNRPKGNMLDDVQWVHNNLLVEDPDPADAPSPGAWAMLQYAKTDQSSFYSIFAKNTLPSRTQLDKAMDAQDKGQATIEFIDELLKVAEESKLAVL